MTSQGKTEVCQKQHGPVSAGPSFPLKEVEDMFSINVPFNLATHLPLRWIADLLYLMR